MNNMRCPTCESLFDSTKATALPFCSERCRLIDLGRWLGEKQSVPHLAGPDDEMEEKWPGEPH